MSETEKSQWNTNWILEGKLKVKPVPALDFSKIYEWRE